MFESVTIYKAQDREYLTMLFNALADIFKGNQASAEIKLKDIDYLYSLRARLERPEDRNKITDMIKNLKQATNKKIEIDFNIYDAAFLLRQVGIITSFRLTV